MISEHDVTELFHISLRYKTLSKDSLLLFRYNISYF